ncbi:MAG TPA: (d)CMP kinase [Lentisphaeria bacterium]|nr:MAG: cytidylate kinase [Lentisphaerae bacterium GWF2_50_93]HCE43463.1 (d)CMP kinase [Lentisphaeria bacterium]
MSIVNVIAIDGPAASGKSTIAQKVADKLGGYYISTGNMYRAITLFAMQNDIPLDSEIDPDRIDKILSRLELTYRADPAGKLHLIMNSRISDSEIRSPEVAKYVSKVAAMENVRAWMIGRQRELASLGLLIMEGRDIGTVIFPDAKYKFFLTASPEVRARRRLAQSGETAAGSTVASVAKEIALRDEMDSKRKIAPLKKADDAIFIDSSDMTVDEVVDLITSRARRK